MDYIVVWDWFERLAGLTPGCQSSDNDERLESFFPQYMRHPGAGSLACSSAIDINVFVLGKSFQFFGQMIGFNADGPLDAFGVGIVIAVAAHVHDLHAGSSFRAQSLRQFLDLYARYDTKDAMLAVKIETISEIDNQRCQDGVTNHLPSGLKSARDADDEVAKDKPSMV